jgi:excisionase family DNA binding protein
MEILRAVSRLEIVGERLGLVANFWEIFMSIETDDRQQASLLDVQAVATLLACSARHVYRLADAGRMPPPVKLGALVRWPRRAIEKWIADGCPYIPQNGGVQ